LARQRDFHPIWGAAAPPLDLVHVTLVAAAIGVFAGGVATSSLVGERSSQPSRNISASDNRPQAKSQSPLVHRVPTETIKSQPAESTPPPIEDTSPERSAIDQDNNSRSLETQTQTPEQPAPEGCNVSLCERSYQSFRASDCSYQPYSGPRQSCTR
jgi:type IV secretory pathway VirB10-like protein